jgi:hypothetical protein
VPKLSTKCEEILSSVHGNFKEQNKVLKPSILIIYYCIITNLLFSLALQHSTGYGLLVYEVS